MVRLPPRGTYFTERACWLHPRWQPEGARPTVWLTLTRAGQIARVPVLIALSWAQRVLRANTLPALEQLQIALVYFAPLGNTQLQSAQQERAFVKRVHHITILLLGVLLTQPANHWTVGLWCSCVYQDTMALLEIARPVQTTTIALVGRRQYHARPGHHPVLGAH